MNYYTLPGNGIYGGIKVGFQFCQMLSEMGLPVVAVTPDGQAPQWFAGTVGVIDRATMEAEVIGADTVIFSLPMDHEAVSALPARRVFHCQGTDPRIAAILDDPEVTLLSCWPQAQALMARKSGREPIKVGLSISECFFYDGTPKQARRVVFMPRRGAAIAAACQAATGLDFLAIDNMTERDCAAAMKQADIFLGTSVGEGFGLPAFEAMAAGCLLVTVPVVGGMDYLTPGQNCIMADAAALPGELAAILSDPARAAAIRHRGIATAQSLSASRQRRLVASALEGPLGAVLSWG